MSVTNVSQSNTFDQWRVKTNTIATDLGDTTALTTTDKTNVVSALNEVKSTTIIDANNFSIAISIALG
jgi:hypothetical protein